MIESNIKVADNLFLSPMGCGTWAWGNRFLWNYDPTMDRELEQVFNLNVSQGVTWFDTGDSYGTGKLKGRSETLLGTFARKYQGDHQNDITIATKLAIYPWRLTPQSMINACQKSAERLGKPVDLVQMHWSPAKYLPWQEKPLLEGLAQLYHQGLVKGIGLSNYGPKNLQKAYDFLLTKEVKISTLQIQYSLLSTYGLTKLELKPLCDELDIKIIAYSPLTLGILTGKYKNLDDLPSGARKSLFKSLLPKIKPLLQAMDVIGKNNGKTMAQVAINWCICQGTIPIPGAKTLFQAKENIGALGWRLSSAEVMELETIALGLEKQMIQNIFQTT
ncbi:MAG: aldo/keto reductase [Cyanobacteria bacterium]|nr:aldo/keto reductase [Cyanobacteria bacterium CG_2015-16_32_12]NCO79346.1 aldo/keto reductase [Cyanobacteria bacterium CG_2015-22_32_23]NCQ05078.1 aldo/keto reductase [Cyanobacteria bacterium CG_2015-09_32_10]NCQ41027.1 aldo/keto reductase [Cyanobacteria bacterium CG_2015-04_32_10]NCS85768.1 aldo/keto reductase [Cyanobacteria bacterium CG_2015-02_32_10]